MAVLALCHATTFSKLRQRRERSPAHSSRTSYGALFSTASHTRVVRLYEEKLLLVVLPVFIRVFVDNRRQRASVPNGCSGGRRHAVHIRKSISPTGLFISVTNYGKSKNLHFLPSQGLFLFILDFSWMLRKVL